MISSLVVVANDDFAKELKDIKEASIEQIIDGKYVVLIDALDFDSNIAAFNKIKALPSVNDVNMAFCEAEEIKLQTDAQKIADKVNALESAENIEYYGNIYKKF